MMLDPGFIKCRLRSKIWALCISSNVLVSIVCFRGASGETACSTAPKNTSASGEVSETTQCSQVSTTVSGQGVLSPPLYVITATTSARREDEVATHSDPRSDINIESVVRALILKSSWAQEHFPVNTPDKWLKVGAVTNPVISVRSVDLGTERPGAPVSKQTDLYKERNCSNIQMGPTVRYTRVEDHTVSVTLTTAFETDTSVTTEFGAKFFDFLSASSKTVENEKLSLTRSGTNTWATHLTVEVTQPEPVPAWTYLVAQSTRLDRRNELPFTATAVIDADVAIEWYDSRGATGTNHYSYVKKLSFYWPNESDRLQTVVGVLTNANVAEGEADIFTTPIDAADRITCPYPRVPPAPFPTVHRRRAGSRAKR